MKFLSDILAKAGLTVDGVVTLNNTATGQTPAANDNSTKLATTAWVRTFVQPYSLPIASASILGGIKVGTGLSIDSGTGILSVTGASASSIKSTQTFVVTEGQTVFTVTNGYAPGLIDIFLNGVYLSPNQSTATNGSTFTLNEAAATGDIIDVIVVSPVYQGTSTTTDQLPEGVVNLYYTNARARAAITLTVNGSSGASSYSSSTGVLNVPTYTLAGLGGIGGSGTTGYVSKFTNSTTIANSLIYDNGFGIGINTSSPYNSSFYSLDVNGALLVKNVGKTANITLINSDPAGGGNNAFVIHTVGGTFGDSYVDIQGYYGASITGSTTIRLNAAGGNLLVGSLIGTGTRMVVASSTGVLSTQDIVTYVSQVKHQVKSAQVITKGQAVYVSSADGTNMIVSKASNAAEMTSSKTMGLLDASVSINGFANVVTEGLLAGLNTASANAGDPVWLGTDGNLIYGLLNKPSAPAHLVFIGIVTRANSNNGEIFVKVQNGFELDELHDLSVKNPSDGDMIKYVASTGLWTKVAASTTNIVEGTNLYYTDARVGTYLTNNSYATQSYVNTAVSNLVDAAPGTLDTLNELAAALGDDPNFATTVAASIGTKEPIITAGTTSQYWRGDKTWQTLPVYTLSGLGGQPQLNGTGFVKVSGTTVSYDNSTYYLASNPNGYITGISFANVSAKPTTIAGYGITDSLVYTTSTYSNPSWITALAWSKITGAPAFITGYTETDTLATVTARGASTSTNSIFTGGLQARKNQTDNDYTTAALWTESYGNTTTGIAFHISGVVGKFLEMRTNGILYWENGQVWTSSTLTNLNQLSNGPGYITQTNALRPVYGDSGAHDLNISGQHATIRFSTGVWVNAPVSGNYSHVLSFNMASDNRTVQMYLGDVPGYLWWRPNQGGTWHPWERIWTSNNLTNLNQLSNGPGYITGYTETDTLASVTGRGASTSTAISLSGNLTMTGAGNSTSVIFGDTSKRINVEGYWMMFKGHENEGFRWQTAGQDGVTYTTRMQLTSSALTVNGNTVLHASNYSSYALPLSGGTMSGGITFTAPGGSILLKHAVSEVDAWIFQENAANWGIYWKNAPSGHHTFGGYTTVGAETFGMSAVNASGNGVSTTNFVGATSAVAQWMLSNYTGYIWSASTIFAAGDMRAPRFYSSLSSGTMFSHGAMTDAFGYNGSYGTYIGSPVGGTYYIYANGTFFDNGTIRTLIHSGSIGSQSVNYANFSGALSLQSLGNGSVNVNNGSSAVYRNENGSGGNLSYAPVLHLGGGDTMWQIQGDYYDSSTLRWRAGYAGTWYTWRNIIHSGNIGSQSVANANTVDNRSIGTSTNNIPFLSGTRNLVINNPESYSGEVRLGAAWDRGGVFASSTLTMSTSSGNINFVSNDTAIGGFRWDGTNGTRFIVSNNDIQTPYTLIDANRRPIMYARGAYPALVLDHTETSNAAHGPTIQFAHNGLDQRQWVIGSSGNGSRLDFGMSNTAYGNSNYNPHNGIGGYLGKTVMRITETGVGIGNLGTFPTILSPSRPLQVFGRSYFSDNMVIIPTSESWAEGLSFIVTSTNTWAGLRWRRERGGNDGNWYVGYTALDATDDLVFGANNGGSQVDNIIRLTKAGNVTLGGSGGTTTVTTQLNINRHIDAYTAWGSCTSIFVGWSSGKVILGNGNSGGHDYALNLGCSTVVSTNPFFCYQDITAYSDSRVKDNVEIIEDAVEKVKAIRGVTFTRNDIPDVNKRHAGVIAQEVLAILPEVVSEDDRGHYSVAYGNLSALLIEAVKEQQSQIESQKTEIEELKDLVKQLINR